MKTGRESWLLVIIIDLPVVLVLLLPLWQSLREWRRCWTATARILLNLDEFITRE